MTDLKFCEPDDVPSMFSEYDKKIEQLDVGKSGKVGLLRLKLEENSDKNKTIIRTNNNTIRNNNIIIGGYLISNTDEKYIKALSSPPIPTIIFNNRTTGKITPMPTNLCLSRIKDITLTINRNTAINI